MGFSLVLQITLCVVAALLLLMPFRNRGRFREQVFQNPFYALMAKRRPDLTEHVVNLATAAWIFGVIVTVVVLCIGIQTFL
ncbi:hypothetical protein [Promicromonospora sukumoe]|uniref:hypothetical protein n=1 Tax=Promicromonospora sukumoe TaxID=88382 RepID=UPI00037F750E|nr:hypothetical protein [Promicromonospora sukumoe]